MWITLIRYWQPVSASIITAALAFLLHTVAANTMEQHHEYELARQQSSLIERCGEVQEAARAASAGHQARLNRLSHDLTAARRLLNASCVRVHTNSSTSGHNAAPGQPLDAGQDGGVNGSDLLDFAAEAEHYRSQLIACQDFVTSDRAK